MKGGGADQANTTTPLADIVRMQPGKDGAEEKSEFNDKIVRDYRILKPIGKRKLALRGFRGGEVLSGIQGSEDL